MELNQSNWFISVAIPKMGKGSLAVLETVSSYCLLLR
jgi:hypothetical protein